MDDAVLDLLHEINKLVEGDLLSEVVNEFTHLGRVSLQTAHNRFQVFHINHLVLLFVKQIKNFLEVLHFVLSKLLDRLGLVCHGCILLNHGLVLRDLGPARLELVQLLSLNRWLLLLFKLVVAHF